MTSWRKHFTVYDNKSPLGSKNGKDGYTSRFQSWLPEVYTGMPNRTERYMQYDQMDMDSEINMALDTVAEFATQMDDETQTPFNIAYKDTPTESEAKILKQALKQWGNINDWDRRIFKTFRNVIKYGDQPFVRDPETWQLMFVNPQDVLGVVINESKGKVPEQYIIKNLDLNLQTKTATTPINMSKTTAGVSNSTFTTTTGRTSPNTNYSSAQAAQSNTLEQFHVGADNIVHVALTEGMDANYPFGTSILDPIFKTYKQKELLEDAIIIYRVQRAPERRVFYIDTGEMPPHRAAAFLEKVKMEVHQKRIPNKTGGGQCFTLDTKIPLLDGRTLELNEIIGEYQAGKENWVYSCNPETGALVPGIITWAGITRENADIIKLTLDNGEVITCTPDHKFPIKGKGKTEAKDIVINEDSLISFNTRMWSINSKNNKTYKNGPEYEQVYDHNINDWVYTHRAIASFFKEMDKHTVIEYENKNAGGIDRLVIHHADFNKLNNNPTNLKHMNPIDHILLHKEHSKEFWNSLSDERKSEIREKQIKSNIEAWKKRKEDEVSFNEYISKKSINRKTYIKNHPEVKELLRNNLSNEMKSPWRNQEKKFDDRLIDRLIYIMKNEYTNNKDMTSIIDAINSDEEFVNKYKSLNVKDEKTVYKIDNSRIEYWTLTKLVKSYGYKNWIDFINKNGMTIKKNSLKITASEQMHKIMIRFLLENGPKLKKIEFAKILNDDEEFKQMFKDHNINIKSDRKALISQNTVDSMIKNLNYTGWSDFNEKSKLYNHKVVSIEYLIDKQDTGTITVDGPEMYHNYHTFALAQGVYTFNSVMDAQYNPLSILEDFFFSVGTDGRGSKVEVLPGGDNLGEISDLKFFTDKMMRGLRIPSSYMPMAADDNGATYTDGRVGTAFIQEFRFNKYCMRLQSIIQPVFDREFKRFLKNRGFNIDAAMFDIRFNEPQSFGEYRQIELDGAKAGIFGQLEGSRYLSRRFILKKYLGLSESELLENEQMYLEENPKGKTKPSDFGNQIGLGDVGIRGGFDDFNPDLGDSDMGDTISPDADIGSASPLGGGQGGPEAGGSAPQGAKV